MVTRQAFTLIFLISVLQFAVGDNYCGKDGVFGNKWQNECDDDEPWCCGFNEDRCCTWEEYSDEHNFDEAAEWSNSLENLPTPERSIGKKIVKIIVGIVVTCVILAILLIVCCCCLPCCFFAKRRKRQAGVIRGHNMAEVTYPSQPQQNNQAPLVTSQQHIQPSPYPPQGAGGYPPQGGPVYPPQAGAAYPPQASFYPPDQPPPYSGPAGGFTGPPTQTYQTKQPAYNPNALP